MRKTGLQHNRTLFLHLLLQVMLVGLTLGMTRTVIPVLAESEFGLPARDFLLLSTFIIAFGIVKGALNFIAGHCSERVGRKPVLVVGWLCALPVPLMIGWAPSWGWIVAATLLLGVNQGLTWSMSQTAKLDIAHAGERGVAIGLNELSGYVGVAIAGVLTAYLAATYGPREGLMWFGLTLVSLAFVLSLLSVQETNPRNRAGADTAESHTSALSVFHRVSWADKRLFAVTQAGMVEKFVDALVWMLYPLFLIDRGASLESASWIVAIYGVTWGGSQLFTGRLSDRIGRHRPNTVGMLLCASGVALILLANSPIGWALCAALTGFGMALLYPNLSAAIADLAEPAWRGSAIGVYRFWRDFGYAIGALLIGVAAQLSGHLESAFLLVALCMTLSALILILCGEESHPALCTQPSGDSTRASINPH
ncbi:MAG: MFS transporter [Oceanospirillales bacterium]|nr:MFS transporter [Oceanospirillales bacterium]